MGQRIGYARVSTVDQAEALPKQIEMLEATDIDEIYSEAISATATTRPALDEMLRYIRKGDTVVITRIDRLARNMNHLHQIVQQITDKGCDLEVTEQSSVNTKSVEGRLMLGMLAAVAQFETELRRERQMEGIAAAKLKGKYKKPMKITEEQVAEAAAELDNTDITGAALAAKYGVARSTLLGRIKLYRESKQ